MRRQEAQTEAAAIGTPVHFGWLRGILGAIFTMSVVDGVATITAVSACWAREVNPLMLQAIGAHPLAFMLAKLLLVLLGLHLLWRHRMHWMSVVGAFGLFLVYYRIMLMHAQGVSRHLLGWYLG